MGLRSAISLSIVSVVDGGGGGGSEEVGKNGQGLWEKRKGEKKVRLLRRKKNRLSQLCERGSKDDEEDKNCTSKKIPPFD